jgi:hypothetical protein
MRHNHCKFGRNRAVTKQTLLLSPKQFISLSRLALQRGDSNITLGTPPPTHTHTHTPTLHNRCKSGRNRAVTKGSLLLMPKQFFVPVGPSVPAGWLKHHMWHSVHMLDNQWRFGWNRAVTKGTLLTMAKQFFVRILQHIGAGWLKTSHMALPSHAPQPL